MANIPEIKLGIVVGSTDWLPSDLAINKRKELVQTYISFHEAEEIYECPICITDNEVSIKRAVKDLDKAECNAVCVYFANYGPESTGTLFAKEFSGPVMFLAAAEDGTSPFMRDRKDAFSGLINACYALGLRKTTVYIPFNPIGTLEKCAELIFAFLPIARTLIAIRNLKIISFSPRPSSYLASYSPPHLLYDLGVEISEYSELELLESFKKHEKDRRISNIVSDMEQELGKKGNKYPEILPQLAQYEITVSDWIRNYRGSKKYVALTSTCWPAFPTSFGFVPCYVNSRITARGIPVACEVDVFGALSEFVGQCISNDIVTILNINNNVPETVFDNQIRDKTFNGKVYSINDLFIGYHCGVTSSQKLISSCMECHFVNKQLIGKEKSQGTIQGQLIPQTVTLFRIQGTRDGKLRAYVAQGQILPVSVDTYGGFGIIAIPEFERFLRYVILEKNYPNHTTIVFGHHGKELISVIQQLGIKEIDYNQPEGCQYKDENAYETLPNWF